MVLWGDNREEVYRYMEVNGVTDDTADCLYKTATAERIRTIRSDDTRKALVGLGLIFAAIIIFSLCWFGLGFIPKILLYACFAALGIGSWKSIDGTAGYLMATSKQGSVVDDH